MNPIFVRLKGNTYESEIITVNVNFIVSIIPPKDKTKTWLTLNSSDGGTNDVYLIKEKYTDIEQKLIKSGCILEK